MTFPQTSSVIATTDGQEYWRLFTQPESSGDIWESEVGARAFVIGPQSDIAKAAITYLDPQSGNGINEVEFSIQKPLVGRLDANLSERYPVGLAGGAPMPARLLITLKDLLPPFGWQPVATAAGVFISVAQPMIDVYQYLTDEPTFIPPRADRQYRYSFGKEALSGFTTLWFCVPFYGRRLAQVTVGVNAGVAGTGAVTIFGVNFSNEQDGGGGAFNTNIDTMIQLDTDAGATPNTEVTSTVRPFDYLAVLFTPSSNTDAHAINILTSDSQG